jgi:phage shock protein PspC (stress-responsive transcriptional regulator)
MEKIIQINYQGRNISIEENALATFQQYENELKIYFQKEDGGDEVIIDLQDRMAEILEQKLAAGSVAITSSDIEEVIATIGRPSDLSGETPKADASQNTNSFSEKKKLYRDAKKSGKFIGGVCSGIANYFAIDPLAIRLLFVLITIFGVIQLFSFNVGVLAYIILWIILPAKDLKETITKKLFRNPKDKILGGVCGGIAHFFNVDAWIIRVAFLAPLFLGNLNNNWFLGEKNIHIFGQSFSSLSFLTYIILWFIVPLAKSATDYMLLKGEPINISTIQNPAAVSLMNSQARSGMNGFLKVVAYILIGLFLLTFIPTALALLTGSVLSYKFSEFILFSSLNKTLAIIAVCFTLFLPIVWFLTGIARRLAGFKPNKTLRIIYMSLHVIGWIAGITLVMNLLRNNNTFVSKIQKINIETSSDTLFVKSINGDTVDNENVVFDLNQFNQIMETKGEQNLVSGVRLKHKDTDEPNFSIDIEKSSCGSNRLIAFENIDATLFQPRIEENTIYLPSALTVSNKQPYHFQNIKTTIHVPQNKTIVIAKQLRNELTHSFRFYKNNFNFEFDDLKKHDEVYTRFDNVIRIDEPDNEKVEEKKREIEDKKREVKDKIRAAKRKIEDAKLDAEREVKEAQQELDKISKEIK